MKRFLISLMIVFCLVNLANCQLRQLMEQPDTVIVKAMVITKPFVNIKGEVYLNMPELYLVVDSAAFYVKGCYSCIPKQDLMEYKDSVITVKIVLRRGLWDTNFPYVKSRIGSYVNVLKIFSD